ncbi:Uncharacterised protein [Chlamydia abortus]|nr:Uncharacterised protein [Chlamydia abortus]
MISFTDKCASALSAWISTSWVKSSQEEKFVFSFANTELATLETLFKGRWRSKKMIFFSFRSFWMTLVFLVKVSLRNIL